VSTISAEYVAFLRAHGISRNGGLSARAQHADQLLALERSIERRIRTMKHCASPADAAAVEAKIDSLEDQAMLLRNLLAENSSASPECRRCSQPIDVRTAYLNSGRCESCLPRPAPNFSRHAPTTASERISYE
jgi:hypothetical protein